MSSEAGESAATAQADRKSHHGDRHLPREDIRQIWRECQEESFWYRALPASLGSMAVTGGLLYQGIWNASKRFGPFPKLAVAGILGYAVGKASYVGTCREKFQRLGPFPGSEDGPGFGPGFGGRGFGPGWPGHRRCPHVCEECKKKEAPSPPSETAQS
ncbi:OCIA domain-containing protein 2 [Hypomesus transpacificus]|uniref:OCIA domain-containing protein 2 n=1 Tax=Hypomesus transpacificus TaxID=137520 RepID=UPI001F07F9F8|nr:OCIA domain-containing protein 2 [Hypomesus transpacificus]